MRILTITPGLGIGGTERSAQNFSIGYKLSGHDVTVLNHGRVGIRQNILHEQGISVINVETELEFFLNSLNLEPFDVVHIHREGRRNDRETKLLKWAKLNSGLVAETNVFYARDYGEGDKYIDLHIQLSEINYKHWILRGGNKKSVIISNPINLNDYPIPSEKNVEAFRKDLKLPQDAYVFGRIGQPIEGKWDPFIIEAFKCIAKINKQVYLLLVGVPYNVQRKIDSCDKKIRSRIKVIDVIDDPFDLGISYKAMDCFLHCAKQGESFGYVLAEALIYGLPVITMSRPHRDNAQVDMISHDVNGYIANSKLGFLEAMQKIQTNFKLSEYVRVSGRQYIEERYGMNAVSCKAIDFFNAIVRNTIKFDNYLCVNIQYKTAGFGNHSKFELMLARLNDLVFIDYLREGVRYFIRKL